MKPFLIILIYGMGDNFRVKMNWSRISFPKDVGLWSYGMSRTWWVAEVAAVYLYQGPLFLRLRLLGSSFSLLIKYWIPSWEKESFFPAVKLNKQYKEAGGIITVAILVSDKQLINRECHTNTAFVYCTYNCISLIKPIYFAINKLFFNLSLLC